MKHKFSFSNVKGILFFLLVLLVFNQCKKEDVVASNLQEILDYIKDNNLDAQVTPSGLYYVIDEPGSERKPTVANEVTVHYEGSLTNGQVFDSSYERNMPATFSLRSVITGWQEGIPLFGKGGKGLLIIPSLLGYGRSGQGGIPPNAVLIFKVELLDF